MKKSITEILVAKDSLSIILLNAINFSSGIDMMKVLNKQYKSRSFASGNTKSHEQNGAETATEDTMSKDTTVEDLFDSMSPKQKEKEIPLDVSVNLVVASLVASTSLESSWLNNCRTPADIIKQQVDWISDRETTNRLAQAQKFGLALEAEKLKQQIVGHQQEKINNLIIEAQSVANLTLKNVEYDDLVLYIEENYQHDDEYWMRVEDTCVRLYEQAVKRLERGEYADLEQEIISCAQNAIKARQEQKAKLALVA